MSLSISGAIFGVDHAFLQWGLTSSGALLSHEGYKGQRLPAGSGS